MNSKFNLRPDQKRALESLYTHFVLKKKTRGKYISACGTGKTVVLSNLPLILKAEVTVFLVPSLNLVTQSWKSFDRQLEQKFEGFLICSDKKRSQATVSEDFSEDSLEELAEEDVIREVGRGAVLREEREIARRIDAANENSLPVIIFCTYQSAHLLLMGINASQRGNVDLLIADEAHRLASDDVAKIKKNDYPPRIALKLLPAKKKVFATATPKFVNGAGVFSMSNTALFGEDAFVYTFAEALADGVVAPFDIILTSFDEDSQEGKEFLGELKQKYVGGKDWGKNWFNDEKVRSAILARGLIKLLKEGTISKGLVYSSSIARAEVQAKELNEAAGEKVALCLSSRNSTEARIAGVEAFGRGDVKIVSNCQLFGEGHDTPSLDFIAFNDPKKSVVAIAQAVGRASRIPFNPETGEREVAKRSKIVIPVGKFNYRQDGSLKVEGNGTAKLALDEVSTTQSNPFAVVQSVLVALDSPGVVLTESVGAILEEKTGGKSAKRTRLPRRFIAKSVTGTEQDTGHGMSPKDFKEFLGDTELPAEITEERIREVAPNVELAGSLDKQEDTEEIFSYIKTVTVDKLRITDSSIPPNMGIWELAEVAAQDSSKVASGAAIVRLFSTADFLLNPKSRSSLFRAAEAKVKVANIDGCDCFVGVLPRELLSAQSVQILEGYLLDAMAIALYRDEANSLPKKNRLGNWERARNMKLPDGVIRAAFAALDKFESGNYNSAVARSAKACVKYAMTGGGEDAGLVIGSNVQPMKTLQETLEEMSKRWDPKAKEVRNATERESMLIRRFSVQRATSMPEKRRVLIEKYLPGFLS